MTISIQKKKRTIRTLLLIFVNVKTFKSCPLAITVYYKYWKCWNGGGAAGLSVTETKCIRRLTYVTFWAPGTSLSGSESIPHPSRQPRKSPPQHNSGHPLSSLHTETGSPSSPWLPGPGGWGCPMTVMLKPHCPQLHRPVAEGTGSSRGL